MTVLAETRGVGSAAPDGSTRPRIRGLVCRNCGRPEEIGLNYVCPACFGPLEVDYDLALVAETLDRETIARRPPGIWRYLELLPVSAPPARGLAVGSTPLIAADRLRAALGVDRLWLKDDTRNPSLSFKDRAVAVASARAIEFGVPAIACASTGNLAGATAAAGAAIGLPAYVFIPADLEPEKIDHVLAYGATVVPIDGTYDDVNRLCLEVADETGWGFVNVNLRPFYAEGSKTLAFELAEALGWRTPDVVVAPIASGALFTKLARGFDQLATIGLIERRPVRFVGGQPAGCAPVATAWANGTDVIEPVRRPDTIVHSLAIGNPADGRYASAQARASGGSIEAIPDEATADAIRRIAGLEGIYTETAGGVTYAAAEAARARGVIRADDEVVVLLTGNGLKTPDARLFGLDGEARSRVDAASLTTAETADSPAGRARPGRPGLAPVIRPSLDAFTAWLES
jgi:threonine synthase